jgi:hypothetical protein
MAGGFSSPISTLVFVLVATSYMVNGTTQASGNVNELDETASIKRAALHSTEE